MATGSINLHAQTYPHTFTVISGDAIIPVDRALITLSKNNVIKYQATTDSNNQATIDMLPGTYTLTVYQATLRLFFGTVTQSTFPQDSTVPLSIPRGYIGGTIQDSSSGLGIGNATVNFYFGTILIFQTTTDSSGLYTSPFLEASNYIVQASAPTYQNNSVGVDVGSTAALGDILLVPNPGSITGKITEVDETTAIEGASIIASLQGAQIAAATSDASGDYTIVGLDTESYDVFVSADTFQGVLTGADVTAPNATTLNVSLSSTGGTITGTVTDATSGSIITGALVQLQLDDVTIDSIQTDKNGQYSFKNLGFNQYILIASADSYSLAFVKDVVTDTTPQTTNFALSKNPGSISGTVTAQGTGIPLSGGVIKLKQGNVTLETDLTDNSGAYNLTGLAAGSYTVYALESGYQTSHTVVTVTKNTNTVQNFALVFGAGSVEGIVTDSGGSPGPVEGAHVKAIKNNIVYGTSITSQDGEYSITGLGAGPYTITVGQDNYRFAYQDVTITNGEATTANFSLVEGSSTVNGTITDTVTGLPLAGVIVNASDQASSFIEYTVTESDGTYSLRGLYPATFIVDAAKAGYFSNDTPSFAIASTGLTLIKDLSLYPEDLPPKNLKGSVLINSFLLQEDRIHKLEWEPTESIESVGYRVYRNGVLIASVALNTSPLVYEDHNTSADILDAYEVTSLNSNGSESSAGVVLLK